MMFIAREWAVHPQNINPVRKLEYGDVSRPGGVNTPDHDTHMTGKAFDMRLIRKGESNGIGFTYKDESIYSLPLTKEFILFVVKFYPGTEYYFNDPALWDKDNDTNKIVKRSGGHDNHLHVMFPGGKE